jgi:hypothetical protein
MANLDLMANEDVCDKRVGGAPTATVLTNVANYQDVAAMRTRLGTINGTYYTSARLDSMTRNDMLYAIRLNDDSAGI